MTVIVAQEGTCMEEAELNFRFWLSSGTTLKQLDSFRKK